MTFVVGGEEAGNLFIKSGIRVLGKLYQVGRYQEASLDATHDICCGWGHIEARCALPGRPGCALCAQGHRTGEHQCSV